MTASLSTTLQGLSQALQYEHFDRQLWESRVKVAANALGPTVIPELLDLARERGALLQRQVAIAELLRSLPAVERASVPPTLLDDLRVAIQIAQAIPTRTAASRSLATFGDASDVRSLVHQMAEDPLESERSLADWALGTAQTIALLDPLADRLSSQPEMEILERLLCLLSNRSIRIEEEESAPEACHVISNTARTTLLDSDAATSARTRALTVLSSFERGVAPEDLVTLLLNSAEDAQLQRIAAQSLISKERPQGLGRASQLFATPDLPRGSALALAEAILRKPGLGTAELRSRARRALKEILEAPRDRLELRRAKHLYQQIPVDQGA